MPLLVIMTLLVIIYRLDQVSLDSSKCLLFKAGDVLTKVSCRLFAFSAHNVSEEDDRLRMTT